MLKLVLGSPPRGDDYFGREALIETLWSRLERDNVLLAAPRRFGKTGAMFRLLDEPRTPYRPLYIDVEHLDSAGDFMVELLATLQQDRHFARAISLLWEETKQFGRGLRDLTSQVQLGSLKVHLREHTDVSRQWRAYGERVMEALSEQGPRLLLLLDELPIMIHQMAQKNPQEVEQFLRWFRAARLAPGTKPRFLVGGSINLISTLDGLGLVDTVNDLAQERLDPFDPDTARRFIRAVFDSQGVELKRGVAKTVLTLLGTPIPYLLSVLLGSVLDRHRTAGAPVTPKLVETVFASDLLSGASPFFRHYYSRLQDYYTPDEARAAKAVLDLLSRADAPVKQNTLYPLFLKACGLQPTPDHHEAFQRLIQKLENDFYVSVSENTCAFANRAIQLWWKNNYGFQGA